MTLKSEFSDLIQRMGANVSIPTANKSIRSSSDLSAMADWIEGGKRAVLFINSRAYRGQDSGEGIDGWVSQNYGRHFIVVKGLSQTESGGVSIKYWDYGDDELKTKAFNSFDDFKKSSFNYWLIKNETQQTVNNEDE